MMLILAALNAAIVIVAPAILGKCFFHIPLPTLLISTGASFIMSITQIRSNYFRNIEEAVKAMIMGYAIFYFVAFIFGAYLFEYPTSNPIILLINFRSFGPTSVWAIWMSSLTFLPATIILGSPLQNSKIWRRVFLLRDFLSASEAILFYSVASLIVGAWGACVVIPLDWGRIWQRWPIPNALVGSVMYLVGATVASFFYRNKRFVPIIEIKAKTPTVKTSPKKKTGLSYKEAIIKSPSKAKRNPAASPKKGTELSYKEAVIKPPKVKHSAATSPTPRRSRQPMPQQDPLLSRSPSRTRTRRKASPSPTRRRSLGGK